MYLSRDERQILDLPKDHVHKGWELELYLNHPALVAMTAFAMHEGQHGRLEPLPRLTTEEAAAKIERMKQNVNALEQEVAAKKAVLEFVAGVAKMGRTKAEFE